MIKVAKLSIIMLALLVTTAWAYEGYGPLTTVVTAARLSG